MKLLHTAAVLGLVVALTAGSTASAKGNKPHPNGLHGKVVSFSPANGTSNGTITVKIHQHGKNKTAATPAIERTFTVTNTTMFLDATTQPAQAVQAVQVGQRVQIIGTGFVATQVVIMPPHKAKGAAKKAKFAGN